MSKKILFIAPRDMHGGANTSMLNLSKTLVNYGHSISVLFRNNGPTHTRFSEEGVNVVINRKILNDVEKNLDFFKQFDLIFFNHWACFSLTELIKKSGKPVIWIVRNYWKGILERHGLNKFHFSIPEKIIFVSDWTRQSLSDLKTQNNFLTIYHGIEIQKIQKFIQENNKNVIREKWGFSKNDIIITLVGRFQEIKGQDVFIEMARIMLQSNTFNLRFLIVGFGPEKELQKIQSLIKKYNLQSKVHVIVLPENIYEIYLISDIFVSCSIEEAFGLAIMEAMAFNLPIIAVNGGGVPEQIEDGINGILIPPGDPITLSKKIEFLLNNPQISENFVKVSNRKVMEFFDIRKTLIRYKNIIKELCD